MDFRTDIEPRNKMTADGQESFNLVSNAAGDPASLGQGGGGEPCKARQGMDRRQKNTSQERAWKTAIS